MNDIEQEFFKVFGIESKELEYPDNFEYYPEITAEKLLELVCVLNKFTGYTSLLEDEYSEIKEEILRDALFAHEQLKLHKADLTKQVRSLFEEVE